MTTQLIPVACRRFAPPRDQVFDEILRVLPSLSERDVIVVTSKVVSIEQGRCVPAATVGDKEKLVATWADWYIPRASSRYGISLSIVYNALISTAGIDESNADHHLIFLPADPSGAAAEIRRRCCERDGINELGVIVSDSHCLPMRQGVVGISIGSSGFLPVYDYRGTPDLFGRPFKVSQTNVADAIAAAAGGIMGEGAEGTPVVVVRGWPRVVFSPTARLDQFTILKEEDLFAPLLSHFSPGEGKVNER